VFSSVRLISQPFSSRPMDRLINRIPEVWPARYEMSEIIYKDYYEAKPLKL